MAHGLNVVIKSEIECNNKPRNITNMEQPVQNEHQSPVTQRPAGTKMGSRRIFTPQFKLQVLESYRNDSDCKGNQRATARKYGIHRRQIQKWLQVENNLRTAVANSNANAAHHTHYHPVVNHNNNSKNLIMNNNNNSEVIMKMPSNATTRHRVVVGNRGNNNNNNNNVSLHTMKFKGTNTCTTSNSGFISPILSYGHEQPAISFTHHRNIATAAPTYEYESSSASLSSLQSSPISSTNSYTTITNTMNISPVHVHQYPGAYVSPPSIHPAYTGTVIKPEPHHPVPSQPHLVPPYVTDPHYYPPVPASVPTYYPTIPPPTALLEIPEVQEAPVKYAAHDNYPKLPDSPIDLSLPHVHQDSFKQRYESRTPSPYHGKWVNVLDTDSKINIKQEINAMDLTCKKRKRSQGTHEEIDEVAPPAKTVKLFKPYLLDTEDENMCKEDQQDNIKSEGFKKNFNTHDDDTDHRQKDAIVWNNHTPYHNIYHDNNNTTYRLSPQSSVYSSPTYPLSPYEVPSQHTYFIPPQASPVSGYDSSSSSIYGDTCEPTIYTVDFKLQSLHFDFNGNSTTKSSSNTIELCQPNSHLVRV